MSQSSIKCFHYSHILRLFWFFFSSSWLKPVFPWIYKMQHSLRYSVSQGDRHEKVLKDTTWLSTFPICLFSPIHTEVYLSNSRFTPDVDLIFLTSSFCNLAYFSVNNNIWLDNTLNVDGYNKQTVIYKFHISQMVNFDLHKIFEVRSVSK